MAGHSDATRRTELEQIDMEGKRRLEGKVALITGAASGIGSATALRFAEEGATIAGVDLAEPAGPAWEKVTVIGKGSTAHVANVADEAALKAAIGAVVDEHGRIDVLVNAAGVSSGGPTEDVSVEEWDRVMDINLKGSFLAAKHGVRVMLAQGSGGSIVHIASIEGLTGLNGQVTYGTSKGAVIQMTRNMAADYAPHGIRVNCVCPGAIETPMTEILNEEGLRAIKDEMMNAHLMKRFGTPVEIANGILYLASDEASFVTGHALVIDGGWTAGRRIEF